MQMPQHRGPDPQLKYAYAQKGAEKRAALFCDKIFVSEDYLPDIPRELSFHDDLSIKHFLNIATRTIEALKERYPPDYIFEEDLIDVLQEVVMRTHIDSLQATGYAISPVYAKQQSFLLDYPSGQDAVYQAGITNIAEIVESETSWEQILEFRKDAEALSLYRSFRLWVSDGAKAKSIRHAQDLIGQRIAHREWALRKHGLKTVTGSLSSILSWDGLTAAAGAAGLTAFLASPTWAAISAGLVIVGKSAVWLAERRIELEDVERYKHPEVAIICEARRRFHAAKRDITNGST